ncbi:ABC transporter substrate-binding protein [Paenibacillus sp. HWE-109]|uniref:ABC transporter substrate-binding protein n=1 Tax=Paenibacillus sp. HWE-109 TaxID=1306526 RepID=UPI001EDC9E6A|nr:ABC transporter substrate-binding protein [Paenibacillus sp. HWE-109]UKS24107.1 ABC transporter substrate-binding protein [Paenibacillus sp. HWE-109]
MKKRLVTSVLSIALTFGLAGCSTNTATTGDSSASPASTAANNTKENAITLKLAMWDSDSEFLDSWTKKVKEFSTVMPNVKMEVETFKSDGDYLQAMKVRLAANELPDIIELKPNFISDFKAELLPLNDLSVTAKNTKAKQYAVDGKILALPVISFPELVYYHPSVFKELGLSVPTTWEQFVSVLTEIKKSGKYQPYAMGGKDSWPNYPFNEFMPILASGDANYYDKIAGMDKPFDKGTPFYKAYTDIQTLYDAKVMGADPLGLSNDQATGLFEAKKAAVIAAGLWYLPQYKSKVGNTDDLAAFALPTRHSESEPLKVMTFTDNFFGIYNKSKNAEAAKKFQEWMFSSDAYSFYVNKKQANSVMEGVKADVPFLTDFYKANKVEEFSFLPGGENFNKYVNSIQLDWKKLGQEMMGGTPLDKIANDLNDKWTKARASK